MLFPTRTDDTAPTRRDGRPAITIDGESIGRAELFAAAGAVAEQVAGTGPVAIHATPSVRTVVAFVGCLQAGVAAVPIPPDAGPRERHHLLADSGARLWIGDRLDDLPDALPSLTVDPRATGTAPAEPQPDSTALIMYTSGTTGAPKGALVSRRALMAQVDGLAAAWQWTPDDVLVHGLPLFHVHGLVLGMIAPLRVGGALVHTGRPQPGLYAAAAEAGGTMFFGVPTVWTRIAADPDSCRALRPARLLVSGSAGLPPTVFRDVRALAGQGPVERYGMTETLITIAARIDRDRRPGWVGEPIAGVQARILDEQGNPVITDGEAIGDLQIRGGTVFDGYLNRADATAKSFTADGWFRTGDVAAIDDQGQYRIVGRATMDLIKSGGYRVGAGEVEAVLLDYPGIEEVAVIGVPDPDLGQRIVAYVVGEPVDETAVINWVASQLSVHKRPREIRQTDALPRNAMGKIQKTLLA